MFQYALLLLLPSVFCQVTVDPNNPVTAFEKLLDVEVERLWQHYDFNSNGKYDIHDAHQFIRDYDTDGNGNVTKVEFMFHWAEDEPIMVIIGNTLFLEYDNDENGVVDTTDVDNTYFRMDTDGDGQVSEAEFKEYQRQLLTLLFILKTQHLEQSGGSA